MVDRNPNWNLIIKSSIEFQRWHIPHGLLSKRNKYYSIISATWNVAKNPSMSHWDWKKLSRARELLYWPGMSQEIKDPVKHCDICNGHRNEQTKQPLLQREVPKWPWRKVTTDLYYMNGDSYLIHLDCFSKFFEVLMLQDTSFTVIKCLLQNVAIHGLSEELNSDNAPEYSSYMFKAFAREFGFKYIKSSLRYSWKLTSEKNCPNNRQDPYLALLELRDTPLPTV